MAEGKADEPIRTNEKGKVRVIRITHEDRCLQTIDGKVFKEEVSPGMFALEAGNTGLSIIFSDRVPFYGINGDFLPGRQEKAGHYKPFEAAEIFCYGLKHLRDYMNSSSAIDKARVGKMKSKTNPVFQNYLVKFFSNGDESIFVQEDSGSQSVEIDLGKLLSLPDSHPIVRKIEWASRRAEGKQFVLSGLVPSFSH